MNLHLLILLLVALQGVYSASSLSVKNSPCYHSCACPDLITLQVSSVCMCPYDCNPNLAPSLNQVQEVEQNASLQKSEPRHLVSWAAQLCGVAALIVLQLATME